MAGTTGSFEPVVIPDAVSTRTSRRRVGHKPPHPGCYCGVHVCDRLEHLINLAVELRAGQARIVAGTPAKSRRRAPGVAVYRVVLRGAIESALYKRIAPTTTTGTGWRGDPLGTWRGTEAEVVGPIINTKPDEQQQLRARYGVPVLDLGNDIAKVVRELARREPPTSLEPCADCGFRTGHALDCAHCVRWWKPIANRRSKSTRSTRVA